MVKTFNTIINFLRETKTELKGVTWLSKKDVTRYTIVVIGVSIVIALFLGGLDYVFQTLIGRFAV